MLPKIKKHKTVDQYQGSDGLGEIHLKSGVNWPASGKLRHSTTVSSQCEIFSYPWAWHVMYFDHWCHFENRCVIVYPIICNQKPLQKAPCYSWPYRVQDDTCRIIGYCHSTVKIIRFSDWYCFFCEMEQKGTLCAIVHWPTMIILFLICFISKCHVS